MSELPLGDDLVTGAGLTRCSLAYDQDVRLHAAPVLHREHLPGPAGVAGLDLVGDEQDPVLAGDLAEVGEETPAAD